MAQLTIEIPDVFQDIPPAEQAILLRSALHQATQSLIGGLKKEIAAGQQHTKRLEAQYGMTFTTSYCPR